MNFKKTISAGLMVAALMILAQFAPAQNSPDSASATVSLSPAATEVVKLAQSGIGDDDVLAYVQSSRSPFNLGSDDIIYLRDIGISSPVVAAMVNQDRTLPAQPAPVTPAPVPVQAAAPAPAYVSDAPADVSYFYSGLSPYGAWVNLENYGWCWQPTAVVVNRNWKPYCDSGHWVYTDAGWFWQSDYSWGWAPFHYGRWFHHDRVGWVWFPDQVWGPAWVTWRYTGDQCGWAPLPLHSTFTSSGFLYNGVNVGLDFNFGLPANLFTFVAIGDFRSADLIHRRLPPATVSQIYGRTAIVNNYVVVNNNVINRGIPVDRVAAAARTEIRPLPVHNVPPGARVETRSGPATAVYRHELAAPARPVSVVAQKVDERHPMVQHLVVAPSNPRPGSAVVNPRPAPAPATRTQYITSPTPATAHPAEAATSMAPVIPPPEPLPSVRTSPRSKGHPSAVPMGSGNVPPVAVADHPESPKPAPPAKPPTPPGPTDYQPRSAVPAADAHTLPPLNSPAPAAEHSSPHVYPTRTARQASEAHGINPNPPPPPRNIPSQAPLPPHESSPADAAPENSSSHDNRDKH